MEQDDPGADANEVCPGVLERLHAERDRIDGQVEDLIATRDRLDTAIATATAARDGVPCPRPAHHSTG